MLGSSLSMVLANRRRNGRKRDKDPFLGDGLVLRGHPGSCGQFKPQHDIMRRYTGMLAPATWSYLKGRDWRPLPRHRRGPMNVA